jgi:hypothetical protein
MEAGDAAAAAPRQAMPAIFIIIITSSLCACASVPARARPALSVLCRACIFAPARTFGFFAAHAGTCTMAPSVHAYVGARTCSLGCCILPPVSVADAQAFGDPAAPADSDRRPWTTLAAPVCILPRTHRLVNGRRQRAYMRARVHASAGRRPFGRIYVSCHRQSSQPFGDCLNTPKTALLMHSRREKVANSRKKERQ